MKRLDHQIALYLGCCLEIRDDDGRRDLVTIRLVSLTWLFTILTSLLTHLPYLYSPQRIALTFASTFVVLLTLALLNVRLLGKIPTPLGVLN